MRTDEEIIQLIKDNQKIPSDIQYAQKNSKELYALVYGEDFHELLINRIEKIENSDRAIARYKYSIDVRDLFERVMTQRNNVFSADGGDEVFEDINEERQENIKKYLDSFKSGKSIDEYLADNLFQLSDVDPNGLIFLEYKSENGDLKEVYPTYKNIHDIRNYEPNGTKLEWVLFAPVDVIEKGNTYKKWRYVDDARDVTVIEKNGFTISEELTFENEFKEVPAVILSNIEKIGTKIRLSWLFFVQELSKKYARDFSVKTIYEFLQGFPKHWRYVMLCNACKGTKQRDGKTCTKCDGKGHIGASDVTDDIMLPLPTDKENDLVVAPNISGFISPDLETLKHMEEGLRGLEDLIQKTMWGVTKEKDSTGSETATGRYIDTQPIINKLNVFSDFAQSVHNTLASYVVNLADIMEVEKGTELYKKIYGKRFIIESPDVLMEKYGKAKEQGQPITVLDKLLSEVISAKYKSEINLRMRMLKKAKVEPYVHLSTKEVFDIFGSTEAMKKQMFSDWWDNEADKNKDEKSLIEDYNKWFNLNNKEDEEFNGQGDALPKSTDEV